MSPVPLLIDSHCHPDAAAFDGDRAAMLARAHAAGVAEMLAIGGGAAPGSLAGALRLARDHEGVWAAAGIHPHDAQEATEASFAEIETMAAESRLIAIGEIGLDFHYDHSPRPVQRAVFERQLALARALDLPVSIHCREAWEECLASVAAARLPAAGVFHCFSGAPAQAEAALALNFYLSFSGMLTFPRAEDLRAAARATPVDRLLIETDAPYLAPVPHRGRRNEPAFLAAVAQRLAELRGWTLEETAATTAANFRRLFPRAAAIPAAEAAAPVQ